MKRFIYQTTQVKIDCAKRLVVQHGGSYDKNKFSIAGIVGEIIFSEQSSRAVIRIDKKPLLVSWEIIKDKLDLFFN